MVALILVLFTECLLNFPFQAQHNIHFEFGRTSIQEIPVVLKSSFHVIYLHLACDLRMYLKTHSGEKLTKCNQCDYVSHNVVYLRRHLKTHSGEKSKKCNQYDYASSRAGNLSAHLKIHSGEKSNKCDLCNYASSEAASLKRHLLTHTREKSIKCKV